MPQFYYESHTSAMDEDSPQAAEHFRASLDLLRARMEAESQRYCKYKHSVLVAADAGAFGTMTLTARVFKKGTKRQLTVVQQQIPWVSGSRPMLLGEQMQKGLQKLMDETIKRFGAGIDPP